MSSRSSPPHIDGSLDSTNKSSDQLRDWSVGAFTLEPLGKVTTWLPTPDITPDSPPLRSPPRYDWTSTGSPKLISTDLPPITNHLSTGSIASTSEIPALYNLEDYSTSLELGDTKIACSYCSKQFPSELETSKHEKTHTCESEPPPHMHAPASLPRHQRRKIRSYKCQRLNADTKERCTFEGRNITELRKHTEILHKRGHERKEIDRFSKKKPESTRRRKGKLQDYGPNIKWCEEKVISKCESGSSQKGELHTDGIYIGAPSPMRISSSPLLKYAEGDLPHYKAFDGRIVPSSRVMSPLRLAECEDSEDNPSVDLDAKAEGDGSRACIKEESPTTSLNPGSNNNLRKDSVALDDNTYEKWNDEYVSYAIDTSPEASLASSDLTEAGRASDEVSLSSASEDPYLLLEAIYPRRLDVVDKIMRAFNTVVNTKVFRLIEKNWTQVTEYAPPPSSANESASSSSTPGNRLTSLGNTVQSNSTAKRKRPEEDDGKEKENRESSGGGSGDEIKKPRLSDKSLRWRCPYFARKPESHRKRESCYKSGFRSISTVLEHIRRAHKLPVCPRCKSVFRSSNELTSHLSVSSASMCLYVEKEVLDVLTDVKDDELRKLRYKNQGRQNDEKRWNQIYKILFPADEDSDIPSPYWTAMTSEYGACSCTPEAEKYRRREFRSRVREALIKALNDFEDTIEDRLRGQLASIMSTVAVDVFQNLPRPTTDDSLSTTEIMTPEPSNLNGGFPLMRELGSSNTATSESTSQFVLGSSEGIPYNTTLQSVLGTDGLDFGLDPISSEDWNVFFENLMNSEKMGTRELDFVASL